MASRRLELLADNLYAAGLVAEGVVSFEEAFPKVAHSFRRGIRSIVERVRNSRVAQFYRDINEGGRYLAGGIGYNYHASALEYQRTVQSPAPSFKTTPGWTRTSASDLTDGADLRIAHGLTPALKPIPSPVRRLHIPRTIPVSISHQELRRMLGRAWGTPVAPTRARIVRLQVA